MERDSSLFRKSRCFISLAGRGSFSLRRIKRSAAMRLSSGAVLTLYDFLEAAEYFIARDGDACCFTKKFAIMSNALHEKSVLVAHGG